MLEVSPDVYCVHSVVMVAVFTLSVRFGHFCRKTVVTVSVLVPCVTLICHYRMMMMLNILAALAVHLSSLSLSLSLSIDASLGTCVTPI